MFILLIFFYIGLLIFFKKYISIYHSNKRDISKYPYILKYLETHKIYVSLTTTPQRIQHIHLILKNLDLTYIENIFLCIPHIYLKDNSIYNIPENLYKINKLKILRIKQDLGPITKLVPAVEYIKNKDSLLITIDDDTIYSNSMINEYIYQKITLEAQNINCVISSKGQNKEYWKLDNFKSNINNSIQSKDLYQVDIIEGFSGIIYNVKDIDLNFLYKMIYLDKSIFFSDDILISYMCSLNNIYKFVLKNSYMNSSKLYQYWYGFKDDAIHKIYKNNAIKYKICTDKIYNYIKNIKS